MSWSTLEHEAPELAAHARRVITQHGFVLAGTIRRDGTPRISPIEAHLVRGHLAHAVIRGTHKARDLRRDPRIVLASPVLHRGDPNEELKLRGRVVEVREPDLRTAIVDAIETASGWRPRDDWHVFTTELGDVAYIAWNAGVCDTLRWRPGRGVDHVVRPVAVVDG